MKKLQERCSHKTKEIIRLRAALKRTEIKITSLADLLKTLEKEKLLSEDGIRILKVISIKT